MLVFFAIKFVDYVMLTWERIPGSSHVHHVSILHASGKKLGGAWEQLHLNPIMHNNFYTGYSTEAGLSAVLETRGMLPKPLMAQPEVISIQKVSEQLRDVLECSSWTRL